jgi:DNA-binding NarL/FixJ family response regulator
MNIRLILADDHQMMREGLKLLIEQVDDMDVVGEADNGADTVELAASPVRHVGAMDVVMPDLNGIEATRKIVAANPNTKVVALSGHANKEFVPEMLPAV